MIDSERVEKAIAYLEDTDEKCAVAKSYMLGLDKQEKTILAVQFMKATGTVAEREAISRTHPEYQVWREKYENAVADFEIMRNRRDTAELIVDVWRSVNANRRHGNV